MSLRLMADVEALKDRLTDLEARVTQLEDEAVERRNAEQARRGPGRPRKDAE